MTEKVINYMEGKESENQESKNQGSKDQRIKDLWRMVLILRFLFLIPLQRMVFLAG